MRLKTLCLFIICLLLAGCGLKKINNPDSVCQVMYATTDIDKDIYIASEDYQKYFKVCEIDASLIPITVVSDISVLPEDGVYVRHAIVNNQMVLTSDLSDTKNSFDTTDAGEEIVSTYLLENMSAEDIFNECLYYFTIPPQEGVSNDELINLLKAPPIKEDGYGAFSFCSSDGGEEPFSRQKYYPGNYIQRIRIETEPRMDGNVDITNNTTSICIVLHNYEIASVLYDLFYEYLYPQYHQEYPDPSLKDIGQEENNIKSGTRWYARGFYDSCNLFDYLTLINDNGVYFLRVEDRNVNRNEMWNYYENGYEHY